jgi:hypothetical protein
MEIYVAYTKKRREFGHPYAFDDVPATILESFAGR